MVNHLLSKRLQLATLGRLALLDRSGVEEPTLGRRPRKLALLSVLAIDRKPMSRDHLAELFWGNREEERAKHSLSDAISHLRQVLGVRAIEATRQTVAITDESPLSVDVLELIAAANAGDDQGVISMYAGAFFAGVHVDASPSFEHWVDRRRAEFERVFLQTCQRQLDLLDPTANPDAALDIAERWLSVEPASERAALAMLAAHANSGRDGVVRALRAYGNLERRLRQELDLQPSDGVVRAALVLQSRLRDSISVVPQVSVAAAAESDHAVSDTTAPVHALRSTGRPGVRRFATTGIAAALLAGILVSFTDRSARDPGGSVVIVPFAPVAESRSQPSTQWLGDGAARLLAAKLSRADVDVMVWKPVSIDTVSATRRLGAAWLITGVVVRHDSVTSLEILLRDPASGAIARRFTVAERDLITAADAAGVQLLSGLSGQNTGPALGGIETHSVDAYRHYVVALRASFDGTTEDYLRNLDAAIALDSGFMSAVSERARYARVAGQHDILARLLPLFTRYSHRLSEWDRLELRFLVAQNKSQHADAEAAVRELLQRFPRDPRAYTMAMHVFAGHGKWRTVDSVLSAATRLGSETGNTLCDPCANLGWWVEYRLYRGDHAGADSIARAFLQRYPGRSGWQMLSRALARSGRYEEALASAHRARAFAASNVDIDVDIARILVATRRLREADSVAREIRRRGDTAIALEVQMLLERERGQFERARRTADALARRRGFEWAFLVGANSVARTGRYDEAAALYESVGGHVAHWKLDSTPAFLHGSAGAARSFAWHHALAADALAPRCDTTKLAFLADSLETIGALSAFGRDWTLHHHVRGIIAACQGRDRDAVASFERAPFTPYQSWTATNVALAQAQLRLKRPALAIAALRRAYYSLAEGMGWYVTRAELDLVMADAFHALGARDSAATYLGYVRGAWTDADAPQRALLERR